MVWALVMVMEVIASIFEIELKKIRVYSGLCSHSGAPLVAEEKDDEFSYLVGIASFGVAKWFVSLFSACFE